MYKLQKKVVEGLSPLTINKTANDKMKIYFYGNSEQETRSGKNKLDYAYIDGLSKTTNGITFTVNDDGGITANGTATANATFDLVKNFNIQIGNYKLVGEDENYSSTGIRGSCKQDGEIKYFSSANTDIKLEGTITNFGVYIVILSGQTVNNITFYPMLLESTETDLTFERGGAMPSPEYPSKIRNVGDNVNLFDKDTTTDGKYIDDAGILKSQETATVSDYIEIKTNKDLYISGKKSTWVSYALYDKDKTFLSRPMTKTPNGVLKVTNTDCKYIRMNLSLEDKDTLKIQQGTQATPYTPFRLWKCRY